ncbi:MAG: undecaprenyl-diphosphate phosphatase [Frankiaceae bacterium]
MSTHVTLWQAVVLGIVEGITEFLPISSTAHLTLVERLMGLTTDNDAVTAYTAVIQDGAIVAAIVYFWRDVVRVVRGWGRGLVRAEARRDFDSRFGWYVILGTIPIGVLAILAKPAIEGPLRSLWVIAAGLILWSPVMVLAERKARQFRSEEELTLRDAITIGLVQCAALIPGVSRSGATISAGLFRGLDRVSATRFSFMLGIPALLAAGVFELPDALKSNIGGGPVLVGVVVSFVVAYASIAWLLRFVTGHSIARFTPYRVLLGALIIGLLVAGTISAT